MESHHKEKILMVHNYYQIFGGEDTVVANEKQLLERHGHEVILYTRHNNEIAKMNAFKKALLPFMTIFNPSTYHDIAGIIQEKNIDIIHVHNTLSLISPAVYYAAVRHSVPVVQTVHNFRFLCPKGTFYRDGTICEDCVINGLGCAVKNRCYRESRIQTLICAVNTCVHRHTGILKEIHFICLTAFNKEKMLSLKQICSEQIFVKPNFVAPGEICGEHEGFIFAGRLEDQKGIKTLIEAWKLMGNNAPHLTICGTGPLEKWCKKQSSGLNVTFKGFVKNEEVRTLIAKSKALILPTLWYEGFPMSIVEAFSVGTPVICSNLGNAGAIVEEGLTGWKFQPGNAGELAKKVQNWSDICNDVKARYDANYTEEANYLQLMAIYRSVQTKYEKTMSLADRKHISFLEKMRKHKR